MELNQVHLMRVLQMPGGTTELLRAGERDGVKTELPLWKDEGWIEVLREVDGVPCQRLIPLSAVQFMETKEGAEVFSNGRKSKKESAAGSGERSGVEQGAASPGRRGRPPKKG